MFHVNAQSVILFFRFILSATYPITTFVLDNNFNFNSFFWHLSSLSFYGVPGTSRGPRPCLSPHYAAQVAPLRCPILRSDLNTVYFLFICIIATMIPVIHNIVTEYIRVKRTCHSDIANIIVFPNNCYRPRFCVFRQSDINVSLCVKRRYES